MSGGNGVLTAEEIAQIKSNLMNPWQESNEKYLASLKELFEVKFDNLQSSYSKLIDKFDRLYAVSEQQWNAVCKHDSEIDHVRDDIKILNEEVFENIPNAKKEKKKWIIGTGISAGGLIILLLQKFGVIK